MRPIRLEVEGFTSFRERVSVDFSDAELFALVGPTGAGKSSVIDAMVFALYGSVPRYDDARQVASVINQRSARALVDFEFTVGTDRYRIVREVQRSRAGGASTREARLERAGASVFDGDARQLTGHVERLLGLTAEQFTKCVVLPQGAFQRFLHDKPSVRQDLLVQLLGVEIFGRVGELARQRQKVAASRAAALDERLGEMEARLRDAPVLVERLAVLERLRSLVTEVVPLLAEVTAEEAAGRRQLEDLDERQARLARVVVPGDLADVAEAVAVRDEELARLTETEQRLAAEEQAAEEELRALPPRHELESLAERHHRSASLGQRIEKGEQLVAEAAGQLAAASSALDDARAARDSAGEVLASTRFEHAAQHVASGLRQGEPCPVCLQVVTDLPVHDAGDLAAAEQRWAGRERAVHEAQERADTARATLQRYEAQLATLGNELAGVTSEIGSSTIDDVERQVAEVQAAEAALDRARQARKAAAEQRAASETKRKKVDKLVGSAWQRFDEARDAVAMLAPPAVDRDDLAGSWERLAVWATDRSAEGKVERDMASTGLALAEGRRRELEDRLTTALAAAGLAGAGDEAVATVASALARAEADRERLEELRDEVGRRQEERSAAAADEQVAGSLGQLLRADAFEKWLLDEALALLVVGASGRLEALSRGQYSLAVDARGAFAVVDHHNADEVRSARTLSGGETFLASLALALALSEQVAGLAAGAAPRLESIFLDEGFGTLDPETLDVVVSAIEELQAGGLVVGLVSHVAELAERMPVRFEVRKGTDGSSVERVSL